MSVLSGKKILLGITAGIAAYKTAGLVRLFIKLGAEVKVIMTPASKDFITPLTLSTLSKNPVHSTFYDKEEENELWNNHVDLGLWADYLLIAPATANTLSKMSNGTCNNLLLATYLSAKCPVYFAPAMDLDMYIHPSTKESLQKLQDFGNILIPATSGELASGLVGEGRMAEPEDIVSFIENDILEKLPLKGKKVLITAGPTYEAIDPVRFIGNRSSGKMGYAIAETLASKGAFITLVSGPSNCKVIHENIHLVKVETAQQMYDACHKVFTNTNIAILSAAVADYTIEKPSEIKIKKKKGDGDELVLKLTKTKDILKSLGKIKSDKQLLIGFALETNDEEKNALKKLEAKNLDFIVLNSLQDKGAGFAHDTNKITILDKHNKTRKFELKSKQEVAKDIATYIENFK